MFLIIPHIVRESILTDENTRAIYTGTSQSVELMRKEPSAESGGGELGGSSAGEFVADDLGGECGVVDDWQDGCGQQAGDAGARWRTCIMAADGTMSATPMTLAVTPGMANHAVGSTFQVSIVASNAHDLFAVPLQVQFDSKVLQLVNVDAGDLMDKDGQSVALVHRDEGNGAVTISATQAAGNEGRGWAGIDLHADVQGGGAGRFDAGADADRHAGQPAEPDCHGWDAGDDPRQINEKAGTRAGKEGRR